MAFAPLCRTLWKSCSRFGERDRSFAQKFSRVTPFAIAERSDSGGAFRSRESAHAARQRPKAPPAHRRRRAPAAAHGGTGSAERHAAMHAETGRRRRSIPGLPNGALRRGRTCSRRRERVPCRTPACSLVGSPAAGRGPAGLSNGWGVRAGAGSAGRWLPRPSSGNEAPGALSRPVPRAAAHRGRCLRARPRQRFGAKPTHLRFGRWRRRGRSGAGPRSRAALRPAGRRAG